MTDNLPARLVEAAEKALAAVWDTGGNKYGGYGPYNEPEDSQLARAATAAVLRLIADEHTVDHGTWWEQNDDLSVIDLRIWADEIERTQ